MTDSDNQQKWPTLPATLSNIAVTKNSGKYESVSSNYFKVGHPRLVFMAENDEQVSHVVEYAGNVQRFVGHQIPFSVRSGGHGITNYSVNDGGIIIDLSQMNQVNILDEAKGLVKVQAGAVWGDVADKICKADLVLSSGDFGDTGVGGLATSGGLGLLVRKQGLTTDQILGATIITADGKKRNVNKEENSDLFWAIRGGGSQVGIVTEFIFQADKVEPAKSGQRVPIGLQKLSYNVFDLSHFLFTWHSWITTATEDMSSLLMLTKNDSNSSIISVQATNIWCGEKTDSCEKYFTDALNIAKVEKQDESNLSYHTLVQAPHLPHEGANNVYVKNVLLTKIDDHLLNALHTMLKSSAVMGIEVRAIDGPINQLSPDFDAWSFREATLFVAMWGDVTQSSLLNQLFKPLQEHGCGVYGAYSSDTSKSETTKAWSRDTRERLQKVVKKYDSKHIINQSRYA
ncbi:FAD-dependent oxidoreductase [Leuconostoc mesenteroides]|uniref:FAD-binding oxidoreductase n=1 Tax=Leuconostoc mesenteroides TaxID=1245 RepID=UPI000A078020|nr:FAD-dependent oxidoreductase [Leuconostoc mesenteroides]MBZ1511239.1 FAD-dependent oxidoreductase [Leuconostoc mesenteroides]MBZ1525297.1 FAD-dependent oxidoreductase [Leuconostoc mesenteroides]ORI95536.1 FAD-binding protein [Leuconostoc mesenteroides subsp. mesenteroides]